MHKAIACASCEADFMIRHDMDEDHYRLLYCPFCGEMMEDEEYEFDIEEEE